MKQLRQLFGQWIESDQSPPPPSTREPAAPDSHIGATEHQIAIRFDRGARVATEISEVTPTEIRSKFVIQGVGITGIGITPREKYIAAEPEPAIGEVVIQEVESWALKDGQCVASLRLVNRRPHHLTENSPLQSLEDDRISSIEGG